MVTTIELLNYRGFQHYRLAGLSRVNLLVGKNNCGKTSVLEAVDILASGGSPAVMLEIAERRGEAQFGNEVTDRSVAPRRSPVLSHFFFGHKYMPGASFRIFTDGELGELSATVERVSLQSTLFEYEETEPVLGVRFERAPRYADKYPPAIPTSVEGVVATDLMRRFRMNRTDVDNERPVTFISPESMEPRSLNAMWDSVLLQGRETEVIAAMRILEPRLKNIFFLSGSASMPRSVGPAGILVAVEGVEERNPLGSFGDGMRRLLALSTALIRTRGGFLLIDEVDTGLHYSVMGDMWKLITQVAEQSDVQVFATTHSLDCIQGLAWLAETTPELRDNISVQKLEPQLPESISFNGSELAVAIGQNMEVR